MYIIIHYTCSLPQVLFFIHISTMLSNINHNWELLGERGRAKKSYWLSPHDIQSHTHWEEKRVNNNIKTRDLQQDKVCSQQPQRKGWPNWVSTSSSPKEGWLEGSLPWIKSKWTSKSSKQRKWAKHTLPCSPQDVLIMVTASTGNKCWRTAFIIASSNSSAYRKSYLSIFPAFGKRERITKASSGLENIIWQSFGY